MENKKELLDKLKLRNKELFPIVFKSFNTIEELKQYKNDMKEIFGEYFENLKQIETLEWELMTPEEKERKLEVARKIKAKTSGNQSQ